MNRQGISTEFTRSTFVKCIHSKEQRLQLCLTVESCQAKRVQTMEGVKTARTLPVTVNKTKEQWQAVKGTSLPVKLPVKLLAEHRTTEAY